MTRSMTRTFVWWAYICLWETYKQLIRTLRAKSVNWWFIHVRTSCITGVTRRATINQHPLPGEDHHRQNSAESQKAEGCIPPSWQARPGGFGTTAFRPQQAQCTHAQETKNRTFLNVSLWWGGPDNRACSSEMLQTPTRANCTVAISNSAPPEIIWGLGGPEEDHQLHHCCWTGRVS